MTLRSIRINVLVGFKPSYVVLFSTNKSQLKSHELPSYCSPLPIQNTPRCYFYYRIASLILRCSCIDKKIGQLVLGNWTKGMTAPWGATIDRLNWGRPCTSALKVNRLFWKNRSTQLPKHRYNKKQLFTVLYDERTTDEWSYSLCIWH